MSQYKISELVNGVNHCSDSEAYYFGFSGAIDTLRRTIWSNSNLNFGHSVGDVVAGSPLTLLCGQVAFYRLTYFCLEDTSIAGSMTLFAFPAFDEILIAGSNPHISVTLNEDFTMRIEALTSGTMRVAARGYYRTRLFMSADGIPPELQPRQRVESLLADMDISSAGLLYQLDDRRDIVATPEYTTNTINLKLLRTGNSAVSCELPPHVTMDTVTGQIYYVLQDDSSNSIIGPVEAGVSITGTTVTCSIPNGATFKVLAADLSVRLL